MSEWQPIETAPKGGVLDHPWIVLACFNYYLDEETGMNTSPPDLIWMATGTWFCNRWQMLSNCLSGFGPNSWVHLRDNPTHWMPLPTEPPK